METRKVRGGILTVLRRFYFFLKRVFGSKLFKFALEEGAKTWITVDQEFGGKLDKSKYQTKSGNWKKDGEAGYTEEKKARIDMWLDLLRQIISVAFPQARGVTSLLFTVLGMLGTEAKATE